MAIGPHQQALADAVRPGDRANVREGEIAWESGSTALERVALNIDAICEKLASTESADGGPAFSGQTATAALDAFRRSAVAMRQRAADLTDARDALSVARVALREATRESHKMGQGKDPGQEPRSTTSNPSQAEIDEHKAWKKRDNAAKADYERRENDSREALADLRAAYVRASAAMKRIHGQPDAPPPPPPPGGNDGNGDGGRPPGGGRTPVKPPHVQDPDPTDETKPPVQVIPPPTQVEPPVTTEPPPPDPGNVEDPGSQQHTNNPLPPPSTDVRPPGSGTSVPVGGSGVGGSVAAGAGLGSVGAAAGGMAAAGIGGRPVGAVGGVGAGSASGARGALGGTSRAGGSSVLGRGGSAGVAGQASRGGAKGGAGGARGGARGAAGASGSRGGRGGRGAGAAGAGGRRGGRDEDRRGATRDLFDDGQDWLDDEEQGPGVLD